MDIRSNHLDSRIAMFKPKCTFSQLKESVAGEQNKPGFHFITSFINQVCPNLSRIRKMKVKRLVFCLFTMSLLLLPACDDDNIDKNNVFVGSGNHGEDDYWIVNLGPDGDLQWQKCFGGTESDYAVAIRQTDDGGFVIAGSSNSDDRDVSGNHGGNDYWVLKIDNKANIIWQRSLGGFHGDNATTIEQTSDKGFIVGGYSDSHDGNKTDNYGGSDIWIVKLDAFTNLEWQKNYGGSGGERMYSIQQTNDGGYIVAGYTKSDDFDVTNNHGTDCYDAWVFKLDEAGNIQWQKCYGGNDHDLAFFVRSTIDGGYIVAGRTSSNDGDVSGNHGDIDYWVFKLSEKGQLQWQKCYGGSREDIPFAYELASDGGLIIAGVSSSDDGDLPRYMCCTWIIKLDHSGNMIWQRQFDSEMMEHGILTSIDQTSDGKYIMAGYGENDDYVIVMLNSTGYFEWIERMGGSDYDIASSIIQTSDGGYIVAGSTRSNDGDVGIK